MVSGSNVTRRGYDKVGPPELHDPASTLAERANHAT